MLPEKEFRTYECHLMYLLLAFTPVLFLSCIRCADSGVFMVWIPIAYYLHQRLVCRWISLRGWCIVAGVGCVAVGGMFLPITRWAVAGRHVERAARAMNSQYVARAQAELARAAQWDPKHPELLYLKYQCVGYNAFHRLG